MEIQSALTNDRFIKSNISIDDNNDNNDNNAHGINREYQFKVKREVNSLNELPNGPFTSINHSPNSSTFLVETLNYRNTSFDETEVNGTESEVHGGTNHIEVAHSDRERLKFLLATQELECLRLEAEDNTSVEGLLCLTLSDDIFSKYLLFYELLDGVSNSAIFR